MVSPTASVVQMTMFAAETRSLDMKIDSCIDLDQPQCNFKSRPYAIHRYQHQLKGCLIAVFIAFLLGCTNTTQHLVAPEQPDQAITVSDLELLWWSNDREKRGSTLHVYIDGDGSPLSNGSDSVSIDPTPKYPLALALAAQDPVHAIYVGRPCHFNVDQPLCRPQLWTSGRYGADAIRYLCEAVLLLSQRADRKVSLIGFSGGGALAVHVANCVEAVVNVVTVNGNLATEVWANLRGYESLSASIDPVGVGLPDRVAGRVYLVGADDGIVPPAVTQHFAALHGGEVIGFRSFGHQCCWRDTWESITRELESRLESW